MHFSLAFEVFSAWEIFYYVDTYEPNTVEINIIEEKLYDD